MHNYWEPSDSMMVDVGTPGIDRGEDDYIPGDEYDPSDDIPEHMDYDPDTDWPVLTLRERVVDLVTTLADTLSDPSQAWDIAVADFNHDLDLLVAESKESK